MRYRGSIAKWLFLAAALLIALNVLKDKGSAFGSLSAGLFIAFAILHAGDRLAKRTQQNDPPK